MRVTGWLAGAAALLLSGCIGQLQINNQTTKVSAPSGSTLPFPARAMLFIPPTDLQRPLIIEATLLRNEETTFKDGEALERATRSILGQTFTAVSTNDTSIKPQLIVKAWGKARFSRRDNLLKVGCGLDVYQADGAMLGSFVARFAPEYAVEYRDAVEPSYTICMRDAAEQMVASAAVAKAARAATAPNPAAYASFVESLGLRP